LFFASPELVLGGEVGTDNGGELVSPKRHVKAHRAIINALRQTGQTSHDAVPAGKGDTNVASLCLWAAAPKEGVAGIHLLQLTPLRESASLRAAMSTLYHDNSRKTSAMLRSGWLLLGLS
uniref:BTB domain-containing protein n=1 Tax=Schistocephalus solidus TaxID=70667 RepID=A0A183SC20_SCHSO